MKRLAVLFSGLLLASLLPWAAFAQDATAANVITLNDATPGIDVAVSMAAGTTGAVSLAFNQASVSVTDTTGNVVFQMADPRAHALELRFAPNTGPFTVTIQRLPGATEAYVQVKSQPDLTTLGTPTLVNNGILSLGQEQDMALNQTTPGQTFSLDIPGGTTGAISASFPGSPVTTQIVDNSGAAVATLYGGNIDGLNVVLDSGVYQMTLLSNNQSKDAVTAVSLMPSTPFDMTALVSAAAQATVQPADTTLTSTGSCTLTVNTASVNLRSGPGTGYSILNYAYRGDQFLVGGTNTEGGWYLVASQPTPAWVSGNLGLFDGTCQDLTVYNIPYREALPPQIVVEQPVTAVVQPAAAPASNNNGGGSNNGGGGGFGGGDDGGGDD
jgi:uncharacterized protein YraI